MRVDLALRSRLALALPSWTWPDLRSGLYRLGAVFTYLLALPLFPDRSTVRQAGSSLLILASTATVGISTLSLGHDRPTARRRGAGL